MSDFDVFLSYNTEDQTWVNEFAGSLRESGVNPWLATEQIQPGERWQDRIHDALLDTRSLVVVFSASSLKSPWTFFEIGAAVADNKNIIPIIVGSVEYDKIPPLISQYKFVREDSPVEAGRAVAEAIGHSKAVPAA